MLIKYVGKKEFKADVVNNTGITWLQDETKEYPDAKAQSLLKFTDIWVQDSESSNQLNAKTQERMQEHGITINVDAVPQAVFVPQTTESVDATVSTPVNESLTDAEKPAEDANLPTLLELLASLSTKKELQAFAKEYKVTYSNTMTEAQLRAKLLRDLTK